MKTLTETIHEAVKADLLRIAAEPEPPGHAIAERYDWQGRREFARHNAVRLDAARWLGLDRLDSVMSMRLSRAYRSGERRGLWWRLNDGGRTIGLQLREAVSDVE